MNERVPSLPEACEILVVGAGPAGIAAACEAATAGKRVVLLDAAPWAGGPVWRGVSERAVPRGGRSWLDRLRRSTVTVVPSATAFAAPAPGRLLVETPSGSRAVAWEKLILATGARERFLPFPGWTLPGVFGPGGLHALANAGWPVKGRRVVVAGTGPLLLAAADGLRQHGARIVLIAEQAPWSRLARFGFALGRHPGKVVQSLAITTRLLGARYRCGWWPLCAEGTNHLESLTLTDGSRTCSCACDSLACGFDLVPNIELPRLLGCAIDRGFVRVNDVQETTIQGVHCAGELTGIGGGDCALVEGRIAGLAAADRANDARRLFPQRAGWHAFRRALATAFALRPELRRLPGPDTIVCRCEDIAQRQFLGWTDWRSARLHTRAGMGACQGRTCGAAAQFLFHWDCECTRPPVFPVTVASLTSPIPQP